MIGMEATTQDHGRIPLEAARADVAPCIPIRRIPTAPVRDARVRKLELSASRLIVGGMGFLSAVSLAWWAVVKLWLVEP
jgi:hypothetical protein